MISVIIPSYNHEKFIAQAIDSVLAQDFTDYELLIADDCSTDNSQEIIKKYNDHRIKTFFFSENKGAVPTLEFLIHQAKGEYIALLNSDDYWHPNKLSKQLNYMEQNPSVGACFTWADIVSEEGKKLTINEVSSFANVFYQQNRSRGALIAHFFYKGNCLCHPSVLIRKNIYDEIGGYNYAYRQLPDFDMWTRLIKKYPIHIIQESLAYHRRFKDNTNTSAGSPENDIRLQNELFYIFFEVFKDIDDSLLKEGFSEKFKKSGELTHEEILCEKAFILLSGTSRLPCALLAFEAFNELLNNQKTRETLLNSYGFTDKDFFKITGSIGFFEITSLKKYLKHLVIQHAPFSLPIIRSLRYYANIFKEILPCSKK